MWLCDQHAKSVLSNSLELVDFSVGLVDFIYHMPDGQVMKFVMILIKRPFS